MADHKPRPIHTIAEEISRNWPKPYFGAKPYLEAMYELTSIEDHYFFDSGRSIVAYFLSNASTWKGPKAREIKAELTTMLYPKPKA